MRTLMEFPTINEKTRRQVLNKGTIVTLLLLMSLYKYIHPCFIKLSHKDNCVYYAMRCNNIIAYFHEEPDSKLLSITMWS